MMADRIVRDELLTSERYWKVSIEAQRLYIHILLNADDTARFSGKNFTIRSACFPGQGVEPEKIESLLSELHDADLVRLYTVPELSTGQVQRFIFVPRFKQRLRFTTSKYPAPPSEISDLIMEKTDASPTEASPESDSRRQKRSEEKRSEELQPPLPPLEGGRSAKASRKAKGENQPVGGWWESDAGTIAEGARQGKPARPGESLADYRGRLRHQGQT